MKTKCSNCQKTMTVPDDAAGKKARCPACKTSFVVEAIGELMPWEIDLTEPEQKPDFMPFEWLKEERASVTTFEPVAEPQPTIHEIAAARMKSYVGPTILIFFLYMLFFIPGLIANFLYASEAKQMERVAGQPLPGAQTLYAMMMIGGTIAAMALAVVVIRVPILLLTGR